MASGCTATPLGRSSNAGTSSATAAGFSGSIFSRFRPLSWASGSGMESKLTPSTSETSTSETSSLSDSATVRQPVVTSAASGMSRRISVVLALLPVSYSTRNVRLPMRMVAPVETGSFVLLGNGLFSRKVPFVDPRSRTKTTPSCAKNSQCFRLTRSCWMRNFASPLRPTTIGKFTENEPFFDSGARMTMRIFMKGGLGELCGQSV